MGLILAQQEQYGASPLNSLNFNPSPIKRKGLKMIYNVPSGSKHLAHEGSCLGACWIKMLTAAKDQEIENTECRLGRLLWYKLVRMEAHQETRVSLINCREGTEEIKFLCNTTRDMIYTGCIQNIQPKFRGVSWFPEEIKQEAEHHPIEKFDVGSPWEWGRLLRGIRAVRDREAGMGGEM